MTPPMLPFVTSLANASTITERYRVLAALLLAALLFVAAAVRGRPAPKKGPPSALAAPPGEDPPRGAPSETSGASSPGLVLDRALFDELRPWAQGVARRFGARSDADAEDIAQEAFIRLARVAPTFDLSPDVPRLLAVRRWLAATLAFVCSEHRRTARRSPVDLASGEVELTEAMHAASDVHEVELRQDLAGILRRFHEATRGTPALWRAWFASEVDGVPVREIARQEGIPINTVYNRIRLARRDLAAMLERERAARGGRR